MLDSALKIGIIRLSSLGDIISTMVFLEFIRTKFARSGRKIEITFIVDTQFRGIVADSAMIDRIIDLPLRASKKNKKLLFEIYKKTRQLGRFDILIDAQGLLKSALIGTLIKKKKFVGFSADSAREKIASFFYTKKATIAYNEHILKRQYELFKTAFDEVNWESDFRLKMLDSRNRAMDSSPKAKAKIAQILAPFKANKKILFLCETSKADKEFSLTSFYALAEGLWSDYKDARIFLIWDKKEAEIRAFGEKDSRFCVLPHLDFDEIKALLGNMDLVIGGDTGITHSAWAMRVPSVTIYISTNMKRFALEGDKHFSIAVSNSPLELHSADFEIFGDFADAPVQSHAPNSQKTPQIPPQILELDFNSNATDSSLRGSEADEAIQTNQSRVSATESRPLRGAKNRNQTSSSASADFLLESDKRGTPPKSEKAAAFWETHLNVVGGSGNRGVQPFLRKEKAESKSKEIVGDSRIAKMDSSLTAFAQNDESMDCHDSAFAESFNAESNADSTQIAQIAQITTFAKKVLQ